MLHKVLNFVSHRIDMIKLTRDGTTTLYTERFKQYYHSIFGVRAESERVFIQLGLEYTLERFHQVGILEMGFGTGFNALLSAEKCLETKRKATYSGLEAYPISLESSKELNFDVREFHEVAWGVESKINDYFDFTKYQTSLEKFTTDMKFNLVYYDAFPPSSQPELWTQEIFEKVAAVMTSDGVLVTYCSKGYVQRNMKAAKFTVERHPGPPRKREVLRAILK
ncbi:MAG: tRNA U34 5-methylaminomethyl-2-thiouridine-forming methyltransferase MnmC [Arcticibacterium sp.]|jgi:tRNA U34 5-methylaminomethyl-2-thiouridine-forming methyltransferase MnmC